MRVISGRYRGMALAGFNGSDIRPTADRVKESLFNIICDRVAGARVLDAFCGSGSLGIECLSRGAEFVHFNDKSAESVALCKKNLSRIEGNYKVTCADFSRTTGEFDLIFIDPPYASEAGVAALNLAARILSEDGIAVYERDRSFTGEIAGLEKYDERKYGRTYLTFFKRS